MADDTVRTLLCLIEGDSTWFKVKPTGSMDIVDLRKLIWEEGIKRDSGILAKDLTLWKVRMTMTSDSTTDAPAG